MDAAAAIPPLDARVRLYRALSEKQELLGFAELVVAGAFVIKNIRIVRSRKDDEAGEPFLAFPDRKGSGAGKDKFFKIAHPITSEARKAASETILRVYQETLERDQEAAPL